MKQLTLLILFVLGPFLLSSAQTRIVEKTFSVEGDQKVRLNLRFGETISVNAWDKNKVSFKATLEINNGKLNEALELDIDTSDGLYIASDYNKEKLKAGRKEDCPDHYSRFSWNNDDEHYAVCSKITYELWVPENIELDVESISGDIELDGLTGPVRAKSISGFIDLSWPAINSADVTMKTISGEAYTDLDNLNFNNKKPHIPIVGYALEGTIGSGGTKLSLESVSGNLYLRKANL